jgi:excisionase family DNA binding protein
MPEDIASVAELARILGISEVAILKRIKRGTVDATKVGRKWHIPRSEVERLQTNLPNPSKPNPDAERPNLTLTVREARESAWQQDLDALTTENEGLHRKLGESEQQADHLRREADTVRAERDSHQDEVKRLHVRVEHLDGMTDKLQETNERLTILLSNEQGLRMSALPPARSWIGRLLGLRGR